MSLALVIGILCSLTYIFVLFEGGAPLWVIALTGPSFTIASGFLAAAYDARGKK